MVLDSMKQIFECSEREGLPFWEIIRIMIWTCGR